MRKSPAVIVALLLSVAWLAICSQSLADTITGLYSQSTGSYDPDQRQIVRIDPLTGQAVALLGQPLGTNGYEMTLNCLAYNSQDGFLYSQSTGSYDPDQRQIVRIDPLGQTVALLGQPLGTNGYEMTLNCLAYNSQDGFLYSQSTGSYDPDQRQIVRIDPLTGQTVALLGQPLGTNGYEMTLNCLAYDSQDGFLYSQSTGSYDPDQGQIVRIDPLTGQTVALLGQPLGTNGYAMTLNCLAYDSQDGFLYSQSTGSYDPDQGQIVRIDPLTGQTVALLGQPLGTNGYEMTLNCLAYVPEPSTFVLLAAGTIGLAAYTWRRRAARSSAQPEAQDDCPAIMAFPSPSFHHVEEQRRAGLIVIPYSIAG